MITIIDYHSLDVPDLKKYEPTGPFLVGLTVKIGVPDRWFMDYLFFICNAEGLAIELNRNANYYDKVQDLRNYFVVDHFDISAILDHINEVLMDIDQMRDAMEILDLCFVRDHLG
jgi:hypothetical protein